MKCSAVGPRISAFRTRLYSTQSAQQAPVVFVAQSGGTVLK